MARRIPEDFVDAVMSRLDIVDVVGSYVSLRRQGRNLLGLCPFHSEKTPSFSVAPEKQIFYCFGCHKGGNALKFLMEIEGLSFQDAVERAAGMVGLEMPEEQISPQENMAIQKRRQYFKMTEAAAEFYQQALWSDAGCSAREYLMRRGISAEVARSFRLGLAVGWDSGVRYLLGQKWQLADIEETGLVSRSRYNQENNNQGNNNQEKSNNENNNPGNSDVRNRGFFDKFHHRLIYPIVDYRGQTVAFGGRIMGDGQPKYLNSPETAYFHKSQNLYGLYQAAAAIRREDEAVLMEGYMDVISAHQAGVNTAVASLGTAFNAEHARLLRRYTTQVLLAYDGDSAGLNAADKAIDVLRDAAFGVRLLQIPEGMDPDDFLRRYGKAGWDRLVSERAQDFWQYRLNKALRGNDVATVHGKVAVMRELKPYLNSCSDAVELDSVVSLVARALGVNPDTVYADLHPNRVKLPQRKFESAVNNMAGNMANGMSGGMNNGTNQGVAAMPQVEKVAANLVLFMLSDREIYEKTLSELGENFTDSPALQELLTLVKNIKDRYDWQPTSLLNYCEPGATYQLLLGMVRADFSRDRLAALADGCIRTIKIRNLQQQLAGLKAGLTNTTADLPKLSRIGELERQIRELRSE